MKTLKNGMEVYTLEEMLDETFGVIGTPERDQMEAKIAKEVAEQKEKSHRITIPANLYSRLRQRAAVSGQSVSSYVRSALALL